MTSWKSKVYEHVNNLTHNRSKVQESVHFTVIVINKTICAPDLCAPSRARPSEYLISVALYVDLICPFLRFFGSVQVNTEKLCQLMSPLLSGCVSLVVCFSSILHLCASLLCNIETVVVIYHAKQGFFPSFPVKEYVYSISLFVGFLPWLALRQRIHCC